ncbi:MAG: VOC family protein [Gemmatimonadaceae bacterium]|jgi:lactoylglutathione lyase
MTVQTATESNIRQAVPFFMVHDIDASLRFYAEGLGFRKTLEWVTDGKLQWCWLEVGDAALMLQEFSKSPQANLPRTALGLGVSICFVCNDAIGLYKEFKSRGVAAKKPFVGNQMWVTSVVDPDGYRLDFESSTDAPEESELSEDF